MKKREETESNRVQNDKRLETVARVIASDHAASTLKVNAGTPEKWRN